MKKNINSIIAVFLKDWKSELRNRYALNSLLMFVIITISIVMFAIGLESVSQYVLSGLLWIIIFFSAVSGLSRTFVSEEERGTNLLLKLIAEPGIIYFGKLLFNIILMLILAAFVALLCFIFLKDFSIKNILLFWITIISGSIGLASALTIIAAIISKANNKGTLFPVLSFPVLLPLLLIVINLTKYSVEGMDTLSAINEILLTISYSGILITVSFWLFEFIWKD
jgi:heme exporter protein B